MKKAPGLIAAIFFLAIGVSILLFAENSQRGYTGVIHLLIASSLFWRVFSSKGGDEKSKLANAMESAFVDDPIRASLIYYLLFYGALTLLNNARVTLGYEAFEVGLLHLLSSLLVLIKYFDQKTRSRTRGKSVS